MSKGNTLEAEVLALIFNATAMPSLAGVTTLYVSLHTADPTEPGTQLTSEATYGSYARQAVLRTVAGWTCTSSSVSPATNILFPQCTSGNITITHAGIGTSLTGAGVLLYSGVLTPNLQVQTGITPRITPSSTITED